MKAPLILSLMFVLVAGLVIADDARAASAINQWTPPEHSGGGDDDEPLKAEQMTMDYVEPLGLHHQRISPATARLLKTSKSIHLQRRWGLDIQLFIHSHPITMPRSLRAP